MTTIFPQPGPGSSSRTRRLWVAGVTVLVAGGAIAAVQHHGGAGVKAADTLVVGDQRGGAEALLRAAGELDHVPYTLQFAQFPAASPLLEALDSKAVDIGGIGGAPFAFAYGSGAQIKAVHAFRMDGAGAGLASALIVQRGSPLRSVADLRGRRVATIRGSAGQDFVLKLLEKNGLRPSDIQWTYLDNAAAKAALSSGAIDAWSTWGSYVGIAVLEDKDRVLADASQLTPDVGFYAANDSAIAAKRPLLEDYLRRLARARTYASAHTGGWAAQLAKQADIPLNVALFTAKSQAGSPVPITPHLVAEQRAIFQRYKAAGIIPSVPNIAGGYDASFNDAVTGNPSHPEPADASRLGHGGAAN